MTRTTRTSADESRDGGALVRDSSENGKLVELWLLLVPLFLLFFSLFFSLFLSLFLSLFSVVLASPRCGPPSGFGRQLRRRSYPRCPLHPRHPRYPIAISRPRRAPPDDPDGDHLSPHDRTSGNRNRRPLGRRLQYFSKTTLYRKARQGMASVTKTESPADVAGLTPIVTSCEARTMLSPHGITFTV